jgi:hypothetical protein
MRRTDTELLLESIRTEIESLKKQQLGQYGSAFVVSASQEVTPPEGKVIVAVHFQGTSRLTALVPEDSAGSASFGTGTSGEGTGGEVVESGNDFISGTTIHGRWTSLTSSAAAAAPLGIIVYFGY